MLLMAVASALYYLKQIFFQRIFSRIIKSSQHSANKTMAYVVGAISGTVSLYEIKEQADSPSNIFG